MEVALRVKHLQPWERRGSFLLLLGRRKLLPAVKGRGVEWETLARENGCGDVTLLSKHLLVTGVGGGQETPVLELAAAVMAL